MLSEVRNTPEGACRITLIRLRFGSNSSTWRSLYLQGKWKLALTVFYMNTCRDVQCLLSEGVFTSVRTNQTLFPHRADRFGLVRTELESKLLLSSPSLGLVQSKPRMSLKTFKMEMRSALINFKCSRFTPFVRFNAGGPNAHFFSENDFGLFSIN